MGKFLQVAFLFTLMSFNTYSYAVDYTFINTSSDKEKSKKSDKPIEIKAPDDREFECNVCINYIPCIDFDHTNDPYKTVLLGNVVTQSVAFPNGNASLALFNSSNPGDQADLGTPHQIFGGPGIGNGGDPKNPGANAVPRKNILIIQDPNSNTPKSLDVKEAAIRFDFADLNGVHIDKIRLIDIDDDQTNARVELFDKDNNTIGTVPIPPGGDNGISTVSLLAYKNVYAIKVVLDGSGGVASICFKNPGINFGTPKVIHKNDNCKEYQVEYTDKAVTDKCGIKKIIRTWYAYDADGNIDSDVQILTFWDTKAPYFVEDLPQDKSVSCDYIPDPVTLTAKDNCDPNVTVIFEETQTEDAQCNANFVITRTWTATDCSGNETKHVQTITVSDTQAPVFVEELPQDATVSCDEIPDQVTLTATDNCDPNVTVVFEETQTEDAQCNANFVITRTWTATDCSGNEVKHIQIITVSDTEAPVFVEELPQDATVSCDEIPDPVTLTATDNCDTNVTVVFEETQTEDAQCNANFVITRTWTATDCSGNEVKHVQTITVSDKQAPVFVEELPQDVTVSCDEVPDPVTLTATDNCDPNVTVAFEETQTEDAQCNANFVITRTWTATDCSGNETKHVQTITVSDTQAPVFVEELPQDATISCDEVPDPVTLTATDNCDPNVTVVFEETQTEDAQCNANFVITRTWTATDCSGNEAKHVQTITVSDKQAPVFVEELPQDATVSCDEIPDPVTLTATDNCDPNVTVVFQETQTEDAQCNANFVITRTWTATDCSGNEAKHVQIITVSDTEAPVFVEELPQDATVSCDEIPDPVTLTATDNCDTNVTVVFEETTEQISDTCPFDLRITRTWTAADCSGNEVIHTQIINVNDTEAPVFVEELPQDITIACTEIPDAPTLTATDNCTGTVEVIFEETTEAIENSSDFRIIRTWTATDTCNNETVHTQTITATSASTDNITIAICVEDDPIDLLSFLPSGTATDGTFEVISGEVTLEGTFFNPLNLPLTDYQISYTVFENGNTCPSIFIFTITVNNDCVVFPCTDENSVQISTVITPNGDPYNEFFEVKGIETCGFIIDVTFFNRWGNKVFEARDYQNNWNGVSRSGSGFLPAGTYYYIVTLRNSGFEPFTGFIYLGTNSR